MIAELAVLLKRLGGLRCRCFMNFQVDIATRRRTTTTTTTTTTTNNNNNKQPQMKQRKNAFLHQAVQIAVNSRTRYSTDVVAVAVAVEVAVAVAVVVAVVVAAVVVAVLLLIFFNFHYFY